jgi:hypothetical protein
MADEKKYTAKEAAQAVLKKAEEMLKAHKSKHEHIGWNKLHGKLEHEGYSKESADKIAGSIKAKVEKTEKNTVDQERADGGNKSPDKKAAHDAHLDKGEMPPKSEKEIPDAEPKSDKAFETKPGKEKGDDPRESEQKAPGSNPKEQVEGNNEEAGTTPTQVGEDEKNKPGYDEMKGRIKLVHFMDLMKQKRGKKVEAPRG